VAVARTPKNSLGRRLRSAYHRHIDYRREVAIRLLLSFVATFALVRALTFGIRYHLLPVGNVVTPGGLHIHHYVWGGLLVFLVGFLALTLDRPRWHPWLAIPFGIGAALVLDEFALLLNLEDVYWAKEGRQSLDAVVIVAVLLAVFLVAERFWRAAAREVAEWLRR
jgi:hypothetical protein